jgi:hypothetical protein
MKHFALHRDGSSLLVVFLLGASTGCTSGSGIGTTVDAANGLSLEDGATDVDLNQGSGGATGAPAVDGPEEMADSIGAKGSGGVVGSGGANGTGGIDDGGRSGGLDGNPASCQGVTCSQHGSCSLSGGAPVCSCEASYHPVSLDCIANVAAPPATAGQFVDITTASGFAAIKGRNGDLSWCFDITVEDIDGDGNNDIFLGDHGADRRLALGDGKGSFTEQVLPTWDAQTWSQLAYDFDNDGTTDFSQNWDSANFGVMRNLGGRSFAVISRSTTIDTGCNGMAWSDWNGDGYPDYMTTGLRGQGQVFRATDNGKFSVVGDNFGAFDKALQAEATLFLADLTGDDRPDVLIQPLKGDIFSGGGLGTRLVQNTTVPLGGGASFSVAANAGLDNLPGPAVALGDFDNDGALDVFGMGSAPNDSATLRYGLFHNDGKGHFTDITNESGLPTTARSTNVYMVLYLQSVFLDYDGDGLLDIFAAEESADRLFRNLGGGRFQEVTSAHGLAGTRTFARPARFMAGDLDGDHDVDIITMRAADKPPCAVQLWRNDVSPANGLAVRLVGKGIKNAVGSKLYLYEAQADGQDGALAAYREVLLSTSHRLPLEQYFALPTGKQYNLHVRFWPSGTVVSRADVKPGRLAISEP